MMKLWVMATLIALMTVSAYPREVQAQDPPPSSGNKLLEICEKEDDGFNFAYCLGYTQGVTDGLVLGPSVRDVEAFFCLPGSATAGQGMRVIKKYLSEHPDKLHQPAVVISGFSSHRGVPLRVTRRPVDTLVLSPAPTNVLSPA